MAVKEWFALRSASSGIEYEIVVMEEDDPAVLVRPLSSTDDDVWLASSNAELFLSTPGQVPDAREALALRAAAYVESIVLDQWDGKTMHIDLDPRRLGLKTYSMTLAPFRPQGDA